MSRCWRRNKFLTQQHQDIHSMMYTIECALRTNILSYPFCNLPFTFVSLKKPDSFISYTKRNNFSYCCSGHSCLFSHEEKLDSNREREFLFIVPCFMVSQRILKWSLKRHETIKRVTRICGSNGSQREEKSAREQPGHQLWPQSAESHDAASPVCILDYSHILRLVFQSLPSLLALAIYTYELYTMEAKELKWWTWPQLDRYPVSEVYSTYRKLDHHLFAVHTGIWFHFNWKYSLHRDVNSDGSLIHKKWTQFWITMSHYFLFFSRSLNGARIIEEIRSGRIICGIHRTMGIPGVRGSRDGCELRKLLFK